MHMKWFLQFSAICVMIKLTILYILSILCSVEIINVDDNRASGGLDNGKSKDYIHPSNMEVNAYACQR